MYPTLAPEINSARIEAGPGPASLIASAQAWRAVAAELEAGAAGFSATIGNLQSAWLGPSAAAMAVNAAAHIAYLQQSSLMATQTAARLDLAVAAYEEVFASVVPTPLIVANRTQSAALIATNFFGQNTPMIATLAAQYAQMWAQDVAAMHTYSAGSAAATAALPAQGTMPAAADPATPIFTPADLLGASSQLGAGAIGGFAAFAVNMLQYFATFQVAQSRQHGGQRHRRRRVRRARRPRRRRWWYRRRHQRRTRRPRRRSARRWAARTPSAPGCRCRPRRSPRRCGWRRKPCRSRPLRVRALM